MRKSVIENALGKAEHGVRERLDKVWERVLDLSAAYVGSSASLLPHPMDVDPGEDEYEFYEAVRCDDCGGIVVLREDDSGVEHCEFQGNTYDENGDLMDEEGYAHCECELFTHGGPSSRYGWPIGRSNSSESRTLALVDLPLCIVNYGPQGYISLTGGGMNLTWEICEGYVRLGYLPPFDLAISLPPRADISIAENGAEVYLACLRSIEVTQRRAKDELERMKNALKEAIQ